MIKESISSIAFKGYQQIFTENMHTILIKRGSLKIHMERRGRGDSGGLFNAKFYKTINRKRLKLSRIQGVIKQTQTCAGGTILLKHKFKTRLTILIHKCTLIFKTININWGFIPTIYSYALSWSLNLFEKDDQLINKSKTRVL